MPLTVQMLPALDQKGNIVGLKPMRRLDSDLLATLKANGTYKARITKLRSKKADGLYFKCIAVAADNWGDEEPWPQGDRELLRAWLQCKAGPDWRKSFTGPAESYHLAVALIEHMRGDGKYAFVEQVQGELRVHIPVSINHDAMGDDEFGPLRTEVLLMLEEKFGCTALELAGHGECAA